MIQITYPGSGNNSQFVYDGLGRNVSIIETITGSVTSTKQFVWCDKRRCESRDGSGSIQSKYFTCGQTISGSNYFNFRDELGSVREVRDGSGNLQARYDYDPFGRLANTYELIVFDFKFAGYYFHSRSSLNLALKRSYSPNLGRWLNRDPISTEPNRSLFNYADNDPVGRIDVFGLDSIILTTSYIYGPDGYQFVHVGLQVETADGVTYINGYPDESNHLQVIIGSDIPPELPGSKPVPFDVPLNSPDDPKRIIAAAKECKRRLKENPLPYKRLPHVGSGTGYTSNQVPTTLLDSINDPFDVRGVLLKNGMDAPSANEPLPMTYVPAYMPGK